jgi:hypothetical protein
MAASRIRMHVLFFLTVRLADKKRIGVFQQDPDFERGTGFGPGLFSR